LLLLLLFLLLLLLLSLWAVLFTPCRLSCWAAAGLQAAWLAAGCQLDSNLTSSPHSTAGVLYCLQQGAELLHCCTARS
jgi:hypothetical protein